MLPNASDDCIGRLAYLGDRPGPSLGAVHPASGCRRGGSSEVFVQPARTPASAGVRRADDGVRTRDPQLGKLMLYQLSYVREASIVPLSAAAPLDAFCEHPGNA
jgi:hypothetical protein